MRSLLIQIKTQVLDPATFDELGTEFLPGDAQPDWLAEEG